MYRLTSASRHTTFYNTVSLLLITTQIKSRPYQASHKHEKYCNTALFKIKIAPKKAEHVLAKQQSVLNTVV